MGYTDKPAKYSVAFSYRDRYLQLTLNGLTNVVVKSSQELYENEITIFDRNRVLQTTIVDGTIFATHKNQNTSWQFAKEAVVFTVHPSALIDINDCETIICEGPHRSIHAMLNKNNSLIAYNVGNFFAATSGNSVVNITGASGIITIRTADESAITVNEVNNTFTSACIDGGGKIILSGHSKTLDANLSQTKPQYSTNQLIMNLRECIASKEVDVTNFSCMTLSQVEP